MRIGNLSTTTVTATISGVIDTNVKQVGGTVLSAQGNIARRQFYDRAPGVQHDHYTVSGLTPAAYVQRGTTYTVPANRMLLLTAAGVSMLSDAAATTPGRVTLYVFAPTEGASIIALRGWHGGVGLGSQLAIAPHHILLQTDTVKMYSQDESVGGSMALELWWAGIEFDV